MVTDSSPPDADAASNGGGVNSPLSRRRSLPSPWASIVRGDSEQNSPPNAAAASGAPGSSFSLVVELPFPSDNTLIENLGSYPESSEINGDANACTPGRLAWNRSLMGIVEPASVMGGTVSWPALSETTRPILRSSSDISRSVSDGSVAPSQAPIISQPPQLPAGNNLMHGRQRLRHRVSGDSSSDSSSTGTGPSQNTFNQPPLPMPPPFPVFEVPYGGMIPAVLDNSIRDARPIGGVGVSQSHDHSSQSSSRRGGYGARPRGDGRYHGGRRDEDCRDAHHPPLQYVSPPMGYMQAPLPPGADPFMVPSHMRVFPGQMGFDMASSFYYAPSMQQEIFRSVPIVLPLAPMIFSSANENPLTSLIIKQIDFYFSDDNLVKDSFLRSKMDDHGWVPIGLIASFRRVQQLTKDVLLILECLRYSTVVEVQVDKVRRRNEWNKWLLSSGLVNSDFGARSPSSAPEKFAASFREVSVDDSTTNANSKIDATEGHMVMAVGQLPEESTVRLVLANREYSAEVHPIS